MSAVDEPQLPPSAPDELADGLPSLDTLLVVLDFDGTLAPIVDHPDDARLAAGAHDAVAALGTRTTVAVLTGRPVDDVRPRLEGLQVEIVGGHGTEALTTDGERTPLIDVELLRSTLTPLEDELHGAVDTDDGWFVEPKPTSIGVHHRRVPPEVREPTLGQVLAAMRRHEDDEPGWVITEGKSITELRPAGLDKGTAMQWLLDRHDGIPLVVGDDVTDEDAFAVAVDHDGFAVLVAEEPRRTSAVARLRRPEDVVAFLVSLADC